MVGDVNFEQPRLSLQLQFSGHHRGILFVSDGRKVFCGPSRGFGNEQYLRVFLPYLGSVVSAILQLLFEDIIDDSIYGICIETFRP